MRCVAAGGRASPCPRLHAAVQPHRQQRRRPAASTGRCARGRPAAFDAAAACIRTTLADAGHAAIATGVSPHITLSYCARDTLEKIALDPPLAWTIDELLLVIGGSQPLCLRGDRPLAAAAGNRSPPPRWACSEPGPPRPTIARTPESAMSRQPQPHAPQVRIPATYMRGGTSKGVFFRLQDLPEAARVPGRRAMRCCSG
jgi:hypothetical protein